MTAAGTIPDTEDTVRRDADPACTICDGAGWHWGWEGIPGRTGRDKTKMHPGDPVKLRCPCVDRMRANQR